MANNKEKNEHFNNPHRRSDEARALQADDQCAHTQGRVRHACLCARNDLCLGVQQLRVASSALPDLVSGAITTVFTFLIAYLVPPAEQDQIAQG